MVSYLTLWEKSKKDWTKPDWFCILYQVSYLLPSWRNWQTRSVQVAVGISQYRFDSCRGHNLRFRRCWWVLKSPSYRHFYFLLNTEKYYFFDKLLYDCCKKYNRLSIRMFKSTVFIGGFFIVWDIKNTSPELGLV